jgi:hypothetical protein
VQVRQWFAGQPRRCRRAGMRRYRASGAGCLGCDDVDNAAGAYGLPEAGRYLIVAASPWRYPPAPSRTASGEIR